MNFAEMKDFTKNIPKENKDLALLLEIDGIKCTQEREDNSLSKSSIFTDDYNEQQGSK